MRDDSANTSPAAKPGRTEAGEAVRCDGASAGPRFEHIPRLAAGLFGTSVAAIVLTERGGHRIAAQVGLRDSGELLDPHTLIPDALMAQAASDGGIVVVPDASSDPLLSACPLVTGPAQARFLAAALLIAADGTRLGLLLVADPEPRAALSAGARAGLAQLAAMTADRLDAEGRAGPRENALGFARATQSAVLTTDSLGIITFANPACEGLLGYEPGALIGENVRVIVPARFHAPHNAGMASLVAGGAPRLAGKTVEVTAVRRDGSDFAMALRCDKTGHWADEPLPPRRRLMPTPFAIGRSTRADAGFRPRIVKTWLDAPFYARSALRTKMFGHEGEGVHESLSLDRLVMPIVQGMLPYRMPRKA